MPQTFTKQILKPGVYWPVDPATGKRQRVEITPDRLRKWAETANKMIAANWPMPAPWGHDIRAVPGATFNETRDNAGYWRKLWVGDDGALTGELQVERDDDVAKIGTTVKYVSPFWKPAFKDGKGQDWEDYPILHIALTNKPAALPQDNFQPVPALACGCLSMDDFSETGEEPAESEEDSEEQEVISPEKAKEQARKEVEGPISMDDVRKALRRTGMHLAEDADSENLPARVIEAANALCRKLTPQQIAENEKEPVKKEEPLTLMMGGDENMSEATPNPLQAKLDKALAQLATATKAGLTGRVTKLLESGRIGPDYAKGTLAPMVEGYQLSLDDAGEVKPSILDGVLVALEALPVGAAGFHGAGQMGHEESLPDGLAGPKQLSDEELDKAVDQSLTEAGVLHE